MYAQPRRSTDLLGACSAALLLIGASTGVAAGPFADFERALSAAYAPYRAALMQTNQKDKPATERSLAAFEAAWGKLMQTWRNAPPPQYVDDKRWEETIGAIDRIVAEAKAETAKGDLAKAHDVLEAIRERLGELRARNGVVTLSDRLDAYHEKMEEVLGGKYLVQDGANVLREHAAVLLHLAANVERYAPEDLKGNAEFKESLDGLTTSAKALHKAARDGNQEAMEKALKGLKPAYARIFVKFG